MTDHLPRKEVTQAYEEGLAADIDRLCRHMVDEADDDEVRDFRFEVMTFELVDDDSEAENENAPDKNQATEAEDFW